MFEGYRGPGPTLGCIVKIISPQSVYRGTYGFVYKLHDSGRIGVIPVGAARKVTYTIKGIQVVTHAEPGEEEAFSMATHHRNVHFGPIARANEREAEIEHVGLVVHLAERAQDELPTSAHPFVETVSTNSI